MSFGRYQTAQLQTALGQAVAGASVYFLSQPATVSSLSPQAQIYADAAGTQPLTQPLLTDGFGEFVAYLAPGLYTVVYISEITGQLVYADQNIAIGGGTSGSTTFDEIGSGVNTTATMVVGSGASLTPSGGGIIKATAMLNVFGDTTPPGTGQVWTAVSPTEAHWATPSGSGVASVNSLTGAVILAVGTGLSLSIAGNTITISLATAFTITSFTGGQAGELGQSFTNPTFNATYSATPSSANITNTDSIDSPLALTTPFTSGTIVGTFTHTTVTTTTFTLTAMGASTQTATQTITWNPRIFGGVGTAGATSSVTATGTTAVLSTSDVLASAGLGAETVGETFGPYTPSGQNIYLLLTGGSHTFTDAGTGFPFAFNAPTAVTFVNEFGVTVSMFLYQSTNPLFGSYTPKVAT